jgi:integrase/recombinase XerD
MPLTAEMNLSLSPEERKNDTQKLYAYESQNKVFQDEKRKNALGDAIETWLLQKHPSTSGESTASIYRKLLISLRSYLYAQGLDLDSHKNLLTQPIQAWANLRTPNSKREGNVAPSTYNQRIAAISSFYTWASKRGIYLEPNPTEQLRRPLVHKYARAYALDVQQVRNQLKKIDRSTARGQRDYALLQVALNTGRSARELASLTWSNLSLHNENITLTFQGGKGGKIMHDMLDTHLSQTLLEYLHTIYGQDLRMLSSQTPIWISFSDRTYRQAIGQQTIADICETHLGISRVHRLRHTFALTMDQLGAPIDLIQTKLGHGNRATTDAYLAELKKTQQPYTTLLANTFGLEADLSQQP